MKLAFLFKKFVLKSSHLKHLTEQQKLSAKALKIIMRIYTEKYYCKPTMTD